MGPEELAAKVREIQRACKNYRPFGVDVLVHGARGGVLDELISAFASGGVDIR